MRKWIWPALGLAGVLLFLVLGPITMPDAQIDLNVTRQESLELSRQFLTERGFDLEGYESGVSFASHGDAVVYMQRTYALQEANQLARTYSLWHWQVRWYQPGEQVEYLVTVDTAEARVLGFERRGLPEEAPGARLLPAEAQAAAESFLRAHRFNPADWQLVGSTSVEHPNRTDHQFSWQHRESAGEAVLKLDATLQGDEWGSWHSGLLVPEQFKRDHNRQSSLGNALATISAALMFFLWVLAVVLAIRIAKRSAWHLGLWGGALMAVVATAAAVNSFSLLKSHMPAALPPGMLWVLLPVAALLTAVIAGAQILFPGTAGQALLQEMGRDGAPHFSRLRQGGLLTPGFAAAAVRGLCLAGLLLGLDTLFYYIGRTYMGVWVPAGPKYSEILATPAPWLYPLMISIMAAFSEEYTFRFFGMAVVKRWLRWTPLAFLLPAVVWAFAHSNYPIFPVWTRGIELTLMGLIFAWVFWKYDIETAIIAHYTYDALLVGWPLLRSGNAYYILSGAIVTLLALVPAAMGWFAARRGRATAVEPGAAPEADEAMAAPAAAAGPAPRAVDLGGAWLDRALVALRTRPLAWGAAGVAGLVLAATLSMSGGPGLTAGYAVGEAEAERIARTYLSEHGFDVSAHRAARALRPAPFLDYLNDVAREQVESLAATYDAARWRIRLYRPGDPVTYDIHVDPVSGAVRSMTRHLPRDYAGGRLTPEEARVAAEAFLRDRGLADPAMILTEAVDSSRDQRADHAFVWESSDPRLPEGGRIRREVRIQGDEVGGFQSAYIHVPESWERAREQKAFKLVAWAMLAVLSALGGVVMAIIYLVRRQAQWRPVVIITLGGAAFTLLSTLKGWPALGMNQDTTAVELFHLASMAISFLFGPLFTGFGLALLWVIGQVAGRYQHEEMDPRQTAMAALGVAGLSLALQTGIMAAGATWVTPPAALPDLSGGWLLPLGLFQLALGALAIELFFRHWLLPLLSRWGRSRLLGLLLQALAVGALSALSLQPGWQVQGLAGLAANGLLFGLAYLAGGLPLAVGARLIAGLFTAGLPLIGIGIPAVAVTGWLAIGLSLLLPLLVWFRGRTV